MNISMMKTLNFNLKPWTIVLLVLIMIDSVVTSYMGTETNALILWTMKTFGLTLNQAMIVRIFYCIPFLVVLNWKDWSKATVFCYIGLYAVLTGLQGI